MTSLEARFKKHADRQEERESVPARLFPEATAGPIHQHLTLDANPIGKGSFSLVYAATALQSGLRVAVKKIPKENMQGQLAMLRSEVDLLRRIRHPNIVQLFDILEDAENVYVVMELMSGGELFRRITTIYPYGYPEHCAAQITRRLVDAVGYLHSKQIIHRDLKPENLIYASPHDDVTLKLSDFGLAKLVSQDALARTACGSPCYVAPEVLQRPQPAEGYTIAVDMWSVGVIAYVLLCGFCPFYHQHMPTLFEKIRRGAFTFPSPYWDNVSPSAKDFISKLLVVDPKARWTALQAMGHEWLCAGTQATSTAPVLPGTAPASWAAAGAQRGDAAASPAAPDASTTEAC